MYGNMRRAMDVLPLRFVLKDVVRRDQDTGEARHVRVTVDATKEFGFCLRHACVDFDGHLTRMRLPMWHRLLRATSGCGVAVDRLMQRGLMPLLEIVVVTTVRVRRVAIARGRRFAIARGRYRRRGQSWPLGRRVPLPPRWFPYCCWRAYAMCAFARPVGLLCQRWRMPGSIEGPACAMLWSGRTGERLSLSWS